MVGITYFFFELCLLRRAPQDLPASSALLIITFLVDLLISTMFAAVIGLSPGIGLIQSLADVIFMLALLYAALYLSNHVARFQQSATALLGSEALLSCVATVGLSLLPPGDEGWDPGGVALLYLAIIVWNILVTGHILRHAFELNLGQGIGIAVLYTYFVYGLVGGLFFGA